MLFRLDRTSESRTRGPGSPANDQAFEYYERLGRVRRYVEAHLADDISLLQVASVARLTPKYFSCYFRKRTGVRFRDWLAHKRIEKARQMLAERDDSITRVSFAVGFNDVRTFQRVFKKTTGVCARTYKKIVAPCGGR